MPVFPLFTLRRLARLRWLLVLGALRAVLPVTLLRSLARGVRSLPRGARLLLPAPLPIILLLAVTAIAVTFAVARWPGALSSAFVTLRLVLLRGSAGSCPEFETRDDTLLDAPANQALDRGQQRPVFSTDQRNSLA